MLFDFIALHRDLLVGRTREKLRLRVAPQPTEHELTSGVPLFLDHFAARLKRSEAFEVGDIGASATLHGGMSFDAGFTIGQVVHGYGDICQVVTELADELDAHIPAAQFKALNMCLDIAIAEAVTEYASRREQQLIGRGVEQLGFLAHELRNLMNTATLAYEMVRSGNVGVGGSTGKLVATSLLGMSELVTRSLAEVRLAAGPPREDRISVPTLLEEVEIAATMQAKTRGVALSFDRGPAGLYVDGDAQIIGSIVTNLVQNACKFTRKQGHVRLSTRVTPGHVTIDVADECGGLPPGKAAELFRPYEQRGEDRSGLGLGLAICMRGALSIGATLAVRDVPGTGCVFSLELRRSPTP
jgi:signal transduction histidine kinase